MALGNWGRKYLLDFLISLPPDSADGTWGQSFLRCSPCSNNGAKSQSPSLCKTHTGVSWSSGCGIDFRIWPTCKYFLTASVLAIHCSPKYSEGDKKGLYWAILPMLRGMLGLSWLNPQLQASCLHAAKIFKGKRAMEIGT